MKLQFTQVCYAAALAAIGSAMKAFLRNGKKKLEPVKALLQLPLAVFVGFLVHCICCQIPFCAPGTGWYTALVAISGYASGPLMDILQQTFLSQVGLILTKKGTK